MGLEREDRGGPIVFTCFEGQTADDVWRAIQESFILGDGWCHAQPSRGGSTHEILHAGLTVTDPRQRWVVSRSPALNPAFALAEMVWIVTGRNDASFLLSFFPGLTEYQGPGPIYEGAYGSRLRQNFGYDQLERAYHALKANGESRQVVLQIWDSSKDMPDDKGQPARKDIPCNIFSLLKIRDGALHWTQVMRSNDVYRGLPYNFVQFTSLHELMAGWLGVELGPYHHLSDSLHVYENTAKHVRFAANATAAENTDRLEFTMEDTFDLFRELAKRVDEIISLDTKPNDFVRRATWSDAPLAIRNIFSVMVAELARRSEARDEAEEIVDSCKNPALRQMWASWSARTTD